MKAEFVNKGGSIFDSQMDALVNPVNTVGVMGAGLALIFKKSFPQNFIEYKKVCNSGELVPGKVHVWRPITHNLFEDSQIVVNFPTKKHWKDPSKIEYISDGLDDLARAIVDLEIESIAIPKLGCGLGGLKWSEVQPLIKSKLEHLPIFVELYEW